MSKSNVKFSHEKFAQLREQKGLTVADFAEIIDVNYKTVWLWAKGKTIPSLESLTIIAHILECDPGRLMNIEPGKETLSDLRYLKLISAKEVADNLGITVPSYTAIERGQSAISPRRAATLAIILGFDKSRIYTAWDNSRAEYFQKIEEKSRKKKQSK
ncbi:helix-turn-helix transcriptional regulator [Corynebacterium crudilactis]|uniref:HTH cro/C1-type domain-containing protein n=1 Tax=Corynebacterium crudilactis TaxID=1652495 RepID=A0A172QXW2_9CORY|nr:helix-turn-helix transcriptional regulator [Corynebacterium crudilactis]ANE05478.1 hypothetical protein ccrud_14145 [Corynebacterium crudilactis]